LAAKSVDFFDGQNFAWALAAVLDAETPRRGDAATSETETIEKIVKRLNVGFIFISNY